ncbi:hypothetical protein E1265_30490 [Streptomyces sp. 8K308]|uniref:DUF5753 domain-containing protein n=1 Tax=Streptomyces sp. 8K308 TaxID=2530388 RepID=UPI00104E6762|nr:DUF5753 domain-containing protein [Streptomyces sp. 8K308]TDC10961.1 hypothetical protein E1265_30490 [Streptomyces sp. 8K308]
MEFIERNVRLRMERKEAILRETNPIELWAILDEAALRRVRGSAEIMSEQHEEIARVSRLDNVTIQVLPLASAAYRPTNSFSMLDFEPSLPPAVVVDGPWGTVSVVEQDHELWTHSRRFDSLRASALAPDETPRFLEELTRKNA